MARAMDPAFRGELRCAGLPAQGKLAWLLAVVRATPETHLSLLEIVRLAAEAGLSTTPAELSPQLERLADYGLPGRLPSTTAEVVFDTVTELHSHFTEETAQTVDLHVSAETHLAILRQALTECPGGVEILVRFRGERPRAEQRLPLPQGAASRQASRSVSAPRASSPR